MVDSIFEWPICPMSVLMSTPACSSVDAKQGGNWATRRKPDRVRRASPGDSTRAPLSCPSASACGEYQLATRDSWQGSQVLDRFLWNEVLHLSRSQAGLEECFVGPTPAAPGGPEDDVQFLLRKYPVLVVVHSRVAEVEVEAIVEGRNPAAKFNERCWLPALVIRAEVLRVGFADPTDAKSSSGVDDPVDAEQQ